MHKISMAAVAAALFAIGFGVWAASTTSTPVTSPIGQGIEPFHLMMNAKEVPTAEVADHTFMFY